MKVTSKFGKKDLDSITEYIVNEWDRRKQKRVDIEREWKDIDRQVAIIPCNKYKLDAKGQIDKGKVWIQE